jgi:hypothetical protein
MTQKWVTCQESPKIGCGCQGGAFERDMHGGQQFVPLLALEV